MKVTLESVQGGYIATKQSLTDLSASTHVFVKIDELLAKIKEWMA